MIRIPISDLQKLIENSDSDGELVIFERGFEEREVREIWNRDNGIGIELTPKN